MSVRRRLPSAEAGNAVLGADRFARATLDSLSSHLCVLDEAGVILKVNQAWRDFATANGLLSGNVCEGANYLAVCDAARGADAREAAAFAAGIRRVVARKSRAFSLEYPCNSPTEERWFIGRVTPFPGDGPGRLVVAHENITSRKQAEEKLRRSEERLQLALDSSNAGAWSWEVAGNISVWDERYRALYGFRPEEPVSFEAWMRRVRPEDRQRLQARIEALLQPGTDCAWNEEFRALHPVKGERWMSGVGRVERDPAGRAVRFAGINLDITERKQAEQALRASEEQFRAMFDTASIGIAQAEPLTGQLLRVNPKMCEITGYSADELLKMRVLDLTYTEDRQKDWDAFQRVVQGGTPEYRLEKRYLRKDGSLAWVNVNMTIVRDAAGQPARTMATIEDITERKQAEQKLERSGNQLRALSARLEKLREEERTRIASEIHDELGQALTAAQMDLRWVENNLSSTSPASRNELLDRVVEAAGFVESIISSVQRLAIELRPSALDSLGLEAAVRMEVRRFHQRCAISCSVSLPGPLAAIPPDVSTAAFRILQEALTNIARHAKASNVEVHIETCEDCFFLAVKDDGVGADPAKLFAPGSLGIFGMQERAAQLGGEVTLTRVLPHGTKVAVRIPLVPVTQPHVSQ